jgi:16S rRNA (guanine527-N7)-methyltransferase
VNTHDALLEQADVPKAARGPLRKYLELLQAWSVRANLTAARTPEQRVGILVAPALALQPLLRPGTLLDVGTGNGAPGLLLGLLDPGRPVTLLEPRARRWAFLREAARACGRPDIDVRRERHEEYRGAPADNVTVRALRLTRGALERLIAPGGQALISWPLAGASRLAVGPGSLAVYRHAMAVVPRET